MSYLRRNQNWENASARLACRQPDRGIFLTNDWYRVGVGQPTEKVPSPDRWSWGVDKKKLSNAIEANLYNKQHSFMASVSVPALNSCTDLPQWWRTWAYKMKLIFLFTSCFGQGFSLSEQQEHKLKQKLVLENGLLLWHIWLYFEEDHGEILECWAGKDVQCLSLMGYSVLNLGGKVESRADDGHLTCQVWERSQVWIWVIWYFELKIGRSG